MSDKIKPHHLGRKAILYVRQSSTHQVMHNQGSRLLQYAMRDRLCALGWREIEVVDDDLGRSAAGSAIRAGFERMVAEVCLGKVGAVAAREADCDGAGRLSEKQMTSGSKRIPTSACKRRSAWCLQSSGSSEVRVRRCFGSWNMICNYPHDARTVILCGDVRITLWSTRC